MARVVFAAPLLLSLACSAPRHPPTEAPAQAAPPAGERSPAAALDALDERSPVPLLPMMALHQKRNMQDHLLAVQEVVGALARDDLAAAAAAARRLGTSDEMMRQCDHMGRGAPGFTERAVAFHRTADGIAAAAEAGDTAAVLGALERTLATCTGCHATFKQQVVDDAEWERRTAALP